MSEQYVDTPVGRARLDWFPAQGTPRAVLLLGHGTATGVEAADLQALARVLPAQGITVVLMTQPYRLDGNFGASNEQSLDQAWKAVWPEVAALKLPIIAGGRSAGSQVACRTASSLAAHAVLALAYPLLGPGSSAELLAVSLPTLVIQGGSDPFGRPSQFPKLPPNFELTEIPSANHMFGSTQPGGLETSLTQLVTAALAWLERLL